MRLARFPLRWKIASFAAALVALAVVSLAWFTVFLPWREKLAAQAAQAHDLVQTVAPTIIRLTPQGVRADPLQVQAIVKNGARGAGGLEIAYALVLDERGVLDESASVANPRSLERLSPQLAAIYLSDPPRALRSLSVGEQPGIRRLRLRLTTREHDDKSARLELGVSTATIDAELRASLWRDALVLLCTLLLAIVGAIVMGSRIARPLQDLALAMGRVKEGDFDQQSNVRAARRRDEVGDLARAFDSMAVGLQERERLRGTLGRYVGGGVAERILEEKDDLALPGELRRVTVLFLDVRGFTTISERLRPPEVLELLNAYFSVIVTRVEARAGHVNKFIGDAAMCIWGAPRWVEEPEQAAVLCALEIQQAVRDLSASRSERGLTTVGIGIGINSGEAIAGNLGAAQRLEYTVIGDAVNLAQRLESQARAGEVLISQDVHDRVSRLVEAAPREPVKLKGKSQPVPLWEVVRRKEIRPEAA